MKRTQLGAKEQWTLGQWLDGLELTPEMTKEYLAQKASFLVKRDVTENNISTILKTIGKEIPRPKRERGQAESIRILAQQLNAVCVALNIPYVSGFEDLLP